MLSKVSMLKFASFLTEASEGKNTHLEHIEDQVLNRGIDGAREAIDFLRALRDMFSSDADKRVNVTTKWDGSPALI